MGPNSSSGADASEKHPRQTDPRGTLALSDDSGYVGETVTFHGRNFPADEHVDQAEFEITE